ncbi:MAG TPA: DUF2089 family protein [Acidobacteriota bacterium]
MIRTLPSRCPSCGQALDVVRLACSRCDTAVEGRFGLPLLARLDAEDQELILSFLTASGSLKELAKRYGLSYPTVRNRLDALIERIERLAAAAESETKEGNHGK